MNLCKCIYIMHVRIKICVHECMDYVLHLPLCMRLGMYVNVCMYVFTILCKFCLLCVYVRNFKVHMFVWMIVYMYI